MICQGAGHATERTDVVSRNVEEEVGDCFISNGWFKDFLLVADRKPLLSFFFFFFFYNERSVFASLQTHTCTLILRIATRCVKWA